MRAFIPALSILAMTALASPVAAEDNGPDLDTGNGFYAACKTEDVVDKLMCVMYVRGWMSGQYAAWAHDSRNKGDQILTPNYCLPPNVTYGQLIDMTVKVLDDKPQIRHFETSNILFGLLKVSFPCPQTEQ